MKNVARVGRNLLVCTALVCVLAFALPSFGQAGLVAAYGFNEGTGTTVTDSSGNGNNGTITSATWTTGKNGGALSFNGTSSRVTIANSASLALTSGMTLEAWVKPTVAPTNWRDIIYKGNDRYYLMASSNQNTPDVGMTLSNGSIDVRGTSQLVAGTWVHLAATYDGATARLYVNGTQVASQARSSTITTSTNPLTIGSDPIFGQYFNGVIDDVRVYNRALSVTEIQTDMNTPVGNVVDTTPPTAPSNLNATPTSSTQVNLTWTASTDNIAVTSYLVERCAGSGCVNFAQIGTSPTANYSDTGLTAGATYNYRVRATDGAGNLSTYSNVAVATTPVADITPPTDPTGLTATASGAQIALNWTASTDNIAVTGYMVERCSGAGCSTFTQIATPTTNAYTDTGLSASTSYSYRVRATDGAGNLSNYSNVASATTGANIGLVAAYSFDEGTGTVLNDVSGNNNQGTISGATWNTTGKFGNSLTFGTSSIVTVPDSTSLHLSTGMTLEAWVYPTATQSSWRDVIYKQLDIYYLESNSDSNVPTSGGTFAGTNHNVFGTSGLSLNTWTHLATTYDGATMRLYVNGVQVASSAFTGSISSSTSQLSIGADAFFGQHFVGRIDEVRIYNRALAASEIQSDMTSPVGVSQPDITPPTAPSNLTASATSQSQINLSWTASTDNVGVTGYKVERCQGSGCSNFAQIATPTTTTFNDTGLTSGTSYSYRVRATDAAANLSAYSNTASATTNSPDTTPPTAPTNLIASPVSQTQINLTWTASTDNIGVTGYLVERCQGVGCTTFTQIATPTTAAFSDTGLTAGTSYSYQVRATDAANNLSAYSNIASATTNAPDTKPPSAPTGLTATAATSSTINLSWTASTDNFGVTGYMVERCLGSGCTTFAQIGTTTTTTYGDSGLSGGATYQYRVRATDAANNLSAYSNTASATTPQGAVGLVASYSFDEGSGTVADDISGNGNNGTVTNATWNANGKFGSSITFNGTSSRVTIPDSASLDLTTGLTLEAWVKPATAPTDWRDIIYKGDDRYYLMGSSNLNTPAAGGNFTTGAPNVYGASQLATGTWTHLASTYDGTTLRLYVNGTLINSGVVNGTILTSTIPLTIGSDSIYGQYFNGDIDEVRVYNRALSAAEIQADMTQAIGGVTPIPIAKLTPGSMSFPNEFAGVSSPAQPATLQNTGTAPMTINGISIVGTNPGDFSFASGCGTTVAVNASCTINVTFTPTAQGTRTATLQVADNAGGSPHTVLLSGFGLSSGGLAVSPRAIPLTPSATQQFATNVSSPVWSVDGVVGGSAATGTITAGGLYTPPTTAGTHTIQATKSTDNTQFAIATAYITTVPGVYTYHYDLMRTGQNLQETVLAPSVVNQNQFGKLMTFPLDGLVFAQPLYASGVTIGGTKRDVIYVATEHDSVYALDANANINTPLWQVSFINPSANITTVPATDTGETGDIPVEIGITSTPVIDPTTNTIYVVAKTKEVMTDGSVNYPQRLHALDMSTGAEKFGGPVVITATAPGTGSGNDGHGNVPLDSLRENQRTALLLYNGVLYFAFGSHGDIQPYHGWVLGYNATTLQQTMRYLATPNNEGGGIWHSGNGIAVDSSGGLFFSTGDGTFTVNSGGIDYGDSVIKMSTTGTVLDYFTPTQEATIDAGNYDLTAGGVMLLPDQPGPNPHLLVAAGKWNSLYLLNRDNLGKYTTTNNSQIVQEIVSPFPGATSNLGNFSTPVYFQGNVYYSGVNDSLKAFQLVNGKFLTAPVTQSTFTFGFTGAAMSVSANGSSNGILWALYRRGSTGTGTLYAMDPFNLQTIYYSSDDAGTRDALPNATKFAGPVVVNGRVYVLTQNGLVIYGLLP